jgi:hypothetical protein
MTKAVDTIIQAVSPEFIPSEAIAEETGIVHRIAVVSRLLIFLSTRFSP